MNSSSHSKSKPASQAKTADSNNVLIASTTAINISLDTNLLTIANQNDFSYILKETGNRLLVVEFFAQWCGPCKILATKLEDLASAYNGTILIVKIDVDVFEELTRQYNVSAIPTFMLMKNQKKLEQFASSNAQTLENILEKYAGTPKVNEPSEKGNKV